MYGHPGEVKEMADAMRPDNAEPQDLTKLFGRVCYIYTRRQALDDGVLVDVSEIAQGAGFRIPVAISHAAWQDCIAWSDADSKRQCHQDEAGRLWDVVWMLAVASRRGGQEVRFQLYRVPRCGRVRKPRLVTLKAVIGPGDEGEPVITIMLPSED